MGSDAPCPLGPPLRVTVGTRAREVGCVLPGPGKRRVVSIRLERLGAPMEPSAHRPGDPVPVRRDALLNNFDGHSAEHLRFLVWTGSRRWTTAVLLGHLEGPQHNGDTASRLADIRRCHRRDIPLAATWRAAPPFPVAPDVAAGFGGPWPRLGAGAWRAGRRPRSARGGGRQLVSRVRTWSSAMSRASSMGRALRAL